MVFNSFPFFIFFALLFPVYWLLHRYVRVQNLLLLAASYLFYGWWDERFLILIAISTTTDYLCGFGADGQPVRRRDLFKALSFVGAIALGLWISDVAENRFILLAGLAYTLLTPTVIHILDRLTDDTRRKAYVGFSVVVNLSILGFFKYANFFADSFTDMLSLAGIEAGYTLVNIVLPVGISFYTFQTMSYTIDIYRQRIRPTHLFLEHATFVAFFPQLVAGPIERARNLIPQFLQRRELNLTLLKSGVLLFIWGLYKKIVVADNLAPIVDSVFANPAAYSSGEVWVAVLAFSFQIYCDFSGYTDMARGAARCLGFELMLNFNIPYISRTPSEFWRRWHISLSSWLRDYLYIPLGGSRQSALKTYRNLFLTMLLGGLWHGAAWTFVLWGSFHGALLALYRFAGIDYLLDTVKGWTPAAVATHLVSWFVMFFFITLSWVLFRAESLGDAGEVYRKMLFEGGWATHRWQDLLFYVVPLISVQVYQIVTGRLEFIAHAPFFLRLNFVLFIVLSIILFGADSGAEFIYFDF